MIISYVIPCYRSEKTIKLVLSEIDNLMNKHTEYQYEVIMVNDSSPDDVWSIIKQIASTRNNVKAISFAKNFGQHAALLAGYRASNGEIIVSLDDDCQTPVDRTFDLISKLDEGYDVVYARYNHLKESLWRRMGSWLSNKMSEVLIDKPKEILGSSFYVMKRFIAEEMTNYQNPYPYIGGLVFRATKRIANVYVDHRDRAEGTSGYSFGKLVKLWFNGFTAFSVVPLRASSLLGTVCAICGFIYGIVTIVRKIIIPEISAGWSSTVAIILLIGGLNLLMLGMLGEYIGRIYICLNKSPQYVVKETINIGKEVKL